MTDARTSTMRITAIGTSGSFAGPASAASCYLLEAAVDHREYRIVVDLGSGALGALQNYVDPSIVDAVILSHLHPDHCLDVTGLYVYRSYDPKFFNCGDAHTDTGAIRASLPVWGPAGTHERLAAAYHTEPGLSPVAGQSHPTDLSTVFSFHDLAPGTTFTIGPVTVTAHLVDHPVEAYALRFEDTSGNVITYSGDSDECDGLIDAARGADVFICEAAFQEDRDAARGIHLTGLRAGRVADAAEAKTLVLTHVPPWTDACTVRAEAAGEFTGPIELARPGNVWQL